MGVSTVKLNGTTIMTVNDTTAEASNVVSPKTFYAADGDKETGSIASKSSSDLTVSGDTVTVPAGVYSSAATKSVASGTEGTPTATKGAVSSHSITVTPSVTNAAGYIAGGTHTGTGVSVSASELVSGTKTISENGTAIDVTNYAAVDVAVPSEEPVLQAKTDIAPTTSSQTITADSGYDGLSSVQINAMPSGTEGTPTATKGAVSSNSVTVTPSVTNVAGYIAGGTHTGIGVSVSASELVSGTKTISANGTGIDVTNYADVDVDVQPTLQSKSDIAPSTSSQTITPDTGYDGLSSVQINAMPSGAVTAPSTISDTGATVSTGTNTLTLSKTVSVTPNVTTAGYISSGTAGNSSVSLTASVTTKAAETYYPSTTDQTVAASQYLTGAQTIKGVTTDNLTAANIKSGVTVKVGDSADDDRVASVTGTYTSDATALAADIAQDETAYVNGTKVTGTMDLSPYASKDYIVRPNLLDNWFFSYGYGSETLQGPIDQRGKILSATHGEYAMDRWRLYIHSGTASIYQGSFEITLSGDDVELQQCLTITPMLLGKTVTLSHTGGYGDTPSGTVTIPSTLTDNMTILDVSDPSSDGGVRLCTRPSPVGWGSQYLYVAMYHKKQSVYYSSLAMACIKLEIGDYSTLMSDELTPLPLPDHAEELSKCQKYFTRLKELSSTKTNRGYLGFATGYNSTTAFAELPLPTTMYTGITTPTITFSTPELQRGSNIYSVSNVTLKGISSNNVIVELTSSGLETGAMYLLRVQSGYIDISCEP